MISKPWLSALVIVLSVSFALWRARTGGELLHGLDLIGTWLAGAATIAAGWLLAGRLTRDRDRRGLITLIVGLWGPLFSTAQVLNVMHVSDVFRWTLLSVLSWTAICVLAIWFISRGTSSLVFASRAAAIAAVFLIVTQSALAAQVALRRAPRVEAADRPEGDAPDVYLIVLDKYSSGRWLAHAHGLDHTPMEEALRALGFVVPTAARANYAHTLIALASLLNWQYFDDIANARPLSWWTMQQQVEEAKAWEAFRRYGYRIVAFPTTFTGTRDIVGADQQLHSPFARRAPFAETWLLNSPLARWTRRRCQGQDCGPTPYPIETLESVAWKFQQLALLADRPGPTFAFLHLLTPHEPYLFNADCSVREPWWPLTDQGAEFDRVSEAYAIQVACLDRLLLSTIRTILERSRVPPVILLQSDHGHGRITVNSLQGVTLNDAEVSPEQIGERLGVFAAYRFPGADALVPDDISPVNVIPLVLHSLFDEPLSLRPDRSFWSTYQNAFTFKEIREEITRPGSDGE